MSDFATAITAVTSSPVPALGRRIRRSVPLTPGLLNEIAVLYHSAVAALAGMDYSENQCRAWSGGVRNWRYWRARLASSYVQWLSLDGKLVGFIACELRFTERGYISHLYVAPPYQGQGVATELVRNLMKAAPELGIVRLSTDASRVSKAVFERCGFTLHGRSYQQKSAEVFEGFQLSFKPAFYVDAMQAADVPDIARLFHQAVQGAGEFYSAAERSAWSPAIRCDAVWRARLAPTRVWVARNDSGLAGFINLLPKQQGEAEIDCLFTNPKLARAGVGSALYKVLEQTARALQIKRLTVEASYFARPFFLKQGFNENRRNEHPRHGEILVNFSMDKLL
ncbi:GNAT family N-acetyltransferase [Shewanella sp.]|uniref:GNAT family N-acetyltransferase n=1 Tax=Shewanella sp. TaxID=50422 RepID=UPI003562C31E